MVGAADDPYERDADRVAGLAGPQHPIGDPDDDAEVAEAPDRATAEGRVAAVQKVVDQVLGTR